MRPLTHTKECSSGIFLDNMDNTRRCRSSSRLLDYPSREVHWTTSKADGSNTKNDTGTRSGHEGQISVDLEKRKPRADRKPTQRSTRSTLDRHRATRDTSTGQLTNTTETRLACGIYTILSSLYAVRNWKIDFVQQIHIRQARNWMAAIGHAIHEVVNLHRCRCGQSYEQ